MLINKTIYSFYNYLQLLFNFKYYLAINTNLVIYFKTRII